MSFCKWLQTYRINVAPSKRREPVTPNDTASYFRRYEYSAMLPQEPQTPNFEIFYCSEYNLPHIFLQLFLEFVSLKHVTLTSNTFSVLV